MLFVPGCRRDWKAPIRDKVSIVRSVGGNGREVVFLRRMVAWALRWACIGQSHRQVFRQGPSCVLYPRFLPSFPGLVTMSSIVINRTGSKRTAFSLLLDSVRTCCRPDLFVNMSSVVINRTKLDWMECSGVRYVSHEFLSNTRLTIGRFLCAHDPLHPLKYPSSRTVLVSLGEFRSIGRFSLCSTSWDRQERIHLSRAVAPEQLAV